MVGTVTTSMSRWSISSFHVAPGRSASTTVSSIHISASGTRSGNRCSSTEIIRSREFIHSPFWFIR